MSEAIRKFGSEFPVRLDKCKECGFTWGEHCDTDCPPEARRAAPPSANDELRDVIAKGFDCATSEDCEHESVEDCLYVATKPFLAQVAARERLGEHKRSCAYCQRDVQTCGRGRELSRGAELQKAVGRE